MPSNRFTNAALLAFTALIADPACAAEQASAIRSFLADCGSAGTRLWGRSLCAPVVVVDETTGMFQASEPAPGPLPATRANTAFDWGGRRWIMVLAPLPAEEAARRDLLFHEAWHVHQEGLGLPANNAVAAHLDGWRDRYLIRLEWQALAAALRSRGAARRAHIEQALAFRAQRLHSHEENAIAERNQMRHEGLAAYTGTALSSAPIARALDGIRSATARSSLGRSFAYVSGPAWGLLLDSASPDWRRQLASGADLPDMMPFDAAAAPEPDRYGATGILTEEIESARVRQARIDAAMAATAEAKALRLPLENIQMDFNPDRVSTGPDGSLIYHRITLRAAWGEISMEGIGLRILPDFTIAFAPWPLEDGNIALATDWQIVELPGGGARLERKS